MSILIVQLSDIHFRDDFNPVTSRAGKIISAIQGIQPRPASCLLLVNGDVAFSGQEAEYKVATSFFNQIIEGLKHIFGDAFGAIFVPGNHDCFNPVA